ncbi:MAG: DNA-3-methyladenine glycosylase family protein [Candidatus Rokuibacteriota bacterium]
MRTTPAGALDHLTRSDPVLAAIIARVGPFAISYREPTFETLARAIVFQQLNGKAARTIWQRLVDAGGGEPLTPDAVRRLRLPALRRVGLSRQKASYVRELARHTADGTLDFAALPAMSDDEVIAALTQIKGIGVWSAHMFLIFALRRHDVLPVGDYGVRAAIKKLYRKRKLPAPRDMERLARSWRPYCSVACWYLWRSQDVPPSPP